MKVTIELAHEMQNKLQLVVGHLELALMKTNSKGAIALEITQAKLAAIELSELIKDQTVRTVETCEECGHFRVRATLETETRKQ